MTPGKSHENKPAFAVVPAAGTTLAEGRLGSWGVYDAQGKKSLKSMTLTSPDFTTEDGSFDKKFRWIDLGVVDFVPGAYFWFAHGHRPELDAMFVDRVVLIAAE